MDTMSRRTVALLIAVVIAGLAPASAIIGYCARMPCCHHAQQPLKMSADTRDCCTTVACYDAPSVKLSASTPVVALTIVPTVIVERGVQQLLPALAASPPPTTQQRLAILSVLLI